MWSLNDSIMLRKFCFVLIFFSLMSCEQLIEVEDISNETVSVLAPSNNAALDTTVVSFSWEPLESAESYHLQIALPNFENTQMIVEDTLISSTNYTKSLEAGTYQWRIKALNFGYQTQYTTQNLTIEE